MGGIGTDFSPRTVFICGQVAKDSESLISLGVIRLRNGQEIRVSPADPGLAKIKVGKRRMVVVTDGRIVAVYGGPRIKLLRMLERGASVNQDLLDCYLPMYPVGEQYSFPSRTTRWRGTGAYRIEKRFHYTR